MPPAQPVDPKLWEVLPAIAAGEDGAVRADNHPMRLAAVVATRRYWHDDAPTLRKWCGEWWHWDGKRYRRVHHRTLRQQVALACEREMARLAEAELKALQQTPGRKAKLPEAKIVWQGRLSSVMELLSGHLALPDDLPTTSWIDGSRGPDCVAVDNGILSIMALLAGEDVETALVPHTPLWFSPVALDYPFVVDADCLTWKRVTHENMRGDQECVGLLQEWAGYCLTPDTAQQRFLFLEGEGANGKSVYCAGLEAILGTQNVSHVPLESFGGRFALYSTLGKLANVATEVGELDKAAEGVLKSYTAGDRMTFDRKGISPLDAAPTARVLLAANNRPRFSDRSGGLWRRMMVVPFLATVPADRRIYGLDKVTWWQDSGELPGMLNWALAGLLALRRRGRFELPEASVAAVEDYQTESNPARAFLVEYCEPGMGGDYVTCQSLYRSYANWCRECGYHALGSAGFGREVHRVFPRTTKVRRGSRENRFWAYHRLRGIGLPQTVLANGPDCPSGVLSEF